MSLVMNPPSQGKAVAVQQHQDIIAANAAAKQAGVTKHMAPAEVTCLLPQIAPTWQQPLG
jgi:nucleotidyltransferase/DNA polymerase involved in DNA repair